MNAKAAISVPRAPKSPALLQTTAQLASIAPLGHHRLPHAQLVPIKTKTSKTDALAALKVTSAP